MSWFDAFVCLAALPPQPSSQIRNGLVRSSIAVGGLCQAPRSAMDFFVYRYLGPGQFFSKARPRFRHAEKIKFIDCRALEAALKRVWRSKIQEVTSLSPSLCDASPPPPPPPPPRSRRQHPVPPPCTDSTAAHFKSVKFDDRCV